MPRRGAPTLEANCPRCGARLVADTGAERAEADVFRCPVHGAIGTRGALLAALAERRRRIAGAFLDQMRDGLGAGTPDRPAPKSRRGRKLPSPSR